MQYNTNYPLIWRGKMTINFDEINLADLKEQLENKPPKIIGGYKRQAWAQKVLDKTDNHSVETDSDGMITAKGILKAKDDTFYPAFIMLDSKQNGMIQNAYFLSETKDHFDLIPLDLALPYMNKDAEDLIPFRYKTMEKIDNDYFQVNWPDFT